MRFTQKENMLDKNFFRKFQQLSMIGNSLQLFEELTQIWDKDDELVVEYDATINAHCILHRSTKFGVTRPICYVDQDHFNMKQFHADFINALKHAWVEELI